MEVFYWRKNGWPNELTSLNQGHQPQTYRRVDSESCVEKQAKLKSHLLLAFSGMKAPTTFSNYVHIHICGQ